MAYGLEGYKRTNIRTADRRKIVVLLYEGAIANLNKAVACLQTKRREEASVLINKTLEIIRFLANALDFQNGGELALRLDSLYAYMRDTLALANVECDCEKVAGVTGLLNTLLEGWRGILEQPGEEAAAAPPPEAPLPAGPEPLEPEKPLAPLSATPSAPPKPRAKGNGYGHPSFRPPAAAKKESPALSV